MKHDIMSVGNEQCHAGKNDISPACRQKGRSFLRDRATARQRENARAFASLHCEVYTDARERDRATARQRENARAFASLHCEVYTDA